MYNDFICRAQLQAHTWSIQWDAYKLLIWLALTVDGKKENMHISVVWQKQHDIVFVKGKIILVITTIRPPPVDLSLPITDHAFMLLPIQAESDHFLTLAI